MMIRNKLRVVLVFFMFLFAKGELLAQNRNVQTDSVKTLNILKKALNDVLEKKTIDESSILDLEIDAMVMDETMTKVGRDFYDMFYSAWVPPKGIKNYTITIKEMVLPGMANEISIFVNESIVFKQRVQPRYDLLEQMSQYGIYETTRFLSRYQQMKNQLGGEDQEGSGIF